jgi:hypothetical protein
MNYSRLSRCCLHPQKTWVACSGGSMSNIYSVKRWEGVFPEYISVLRVVSSRGFPELYTVWNVKHNKLMYYHVRTTSIPSFVLGIMEKMTWVWLRGEAFSYYSDTPRRSVRKRYCNRFDPRGNNSINTVQQATIGEAVFSMSSAPHPVWLTDKSTCSLTGDKCFLCGLRHATIEGLCFMCVVCAERI